jgi:Family of unknown function (DUF6868)
MDIQILTRFFMVCTLLNAGFLVVFFLFLTVAGDWVYRIHGKWFPMPRETFNKTVYSFMGFYKIAVVIFSLVPWLALMIMAE